MAGRPTGLAGGNEGAIELGELAGLPALLVELSWGAGSSRPFALVGVSCLAPVEEAAAAVDPGEDGCWSEPVCERAVDSEKERSPKTASERIQAGMLKLPVELIDPIVRR